MSNRALDRLNRDTNVSALVARNREINRRSRPQIGVVQGRNGDGTYVVQTANGTITANSLSSGAVSGAVQVLQPLGAPIAYIDTYQAQ